MYRFSCERTQSATERQTDNWDKQNVSSGEAGKALFSFIPLACVYSASLRHAATGIPTHWTCSALPNPSVSLVTGQFELILFYYFTFFTLITSDEYKG